MDTVVPLNNNNSTLQKSTWEHYITDLADPRTAGWFLIGSPLPVLTILALYLLFVLKLGPNYMKNRKPYNLKRTIMIYNLLQVAANVYLFNEAIQMWKGYNWNCQNVDYSNTPLAIRHAWACYLYFLNKISDLLDTVFFILRKKEKQVTFLHVFHHTIMPLITWTMVKYVAGGQITFIGLLNTFVHILLYAYYYLAAFGPEVQKYLWWKKYITKLQLIQFCLVFLHNSQILFFDCGFPRWTLGMILPNAVFFYYLFSDFYKKSYTAPPKNDLKKESAKTK